MEQKNSASECGGSKAQEIYIERVGVTIEVKFFPNVY